MDEPTATATSVERRKDRFIFKDEQRVFSPIIYSCKCKMRSAERKNGATSPSAVSRGKRQRLAPLCSTLRSSLGSALGAAELEASLAGRLEGKDLALVYPKIWKLAHDAALCERGSGGMRSRAVAVEKAWTAVSAKGASYEAVVDIAKRELASMPSRGPVAGPVPSYNSQAFFSALSVSPTAAWHARELSVALAWELARLPLLEEELRQSIVDAVSLAQRATWRACRGKAPRRRAGAAGAESAEWYRGWGPSPSPPCRWGGRAYPLFTRRERDRLAEEGSASFAKRAQEAAMRAELQRAARERGGEGNSRGGGGGARGRAAAAAYWRAGKTSLEQRVEDAAATLLSSRGDLDFALRRLHRAEMRRARALRSVLSAQGEEFVHNTCSACGSWRQERAAAAAAAATGNGARRGEEAPPVPTPDPGPPPVLMTPAEAALLLLDRHQRRRKRQRQQQQGKGKGRNEKPDEISSAVAAEVALLRDARRAMSRYSALSASVADFFELARAAALCRHSSGKGGEGTSASSARRAPSDPRPRPPPKLRLESASEVDALRIELAEALGAAEGEGWSATDVRDTSVGRKAKLSLASIEAEWFAARDALAGDAAGNPELSRKLSQLFGALGEDVDRRFEQASSPTWFDAEVERKVGADGDETQQPVDGNLFSAVFAPRLERLGLRLDGL